MAAASSSASTVTTVKATSADAALTVPIKATLTVQTSHDVATAAISAAAKSVAVATAAPFSATNPLQTSHNAATTPIPASNDPKLLSLVAKSHYDVDMSIVNSFDVSPSFAAQVLTWATDRTISAETLEKKAADDKASKMARFLRNPIQDTNIVGQCRADHFDHLISQKLKTPISTLYDQYQRLRYDAPNAGVTRVALERQGFQFPTDAKKEVVSAAAASLPQLPSKPNTNSYVATTVYTVSPSLLERFSKDVALAKMAIDLTIDRNLTSEALAHGVMAMPNKQGQSDAFALARYLRNPSSSTAILADIPPSGKNFEITAGCLADCYANNINRLFYLYRSELSQRYAKTKADTSPNVATFQIALERAGVNYS